jgi:N6-adenosine-specific RNA methylase IME4
MVRLTTLGKFSTILADPPWRFQNRTGKMAPEHRRLRRYETMSLDEIANMPVRKLSTNPSHLYLWCPNALLQDGLWGNAGMGFHLQNESRVVQDQKRRWPRRTWGRLLLSERN